MLKDVQILKWLISAGGSGALQETGAGEDQAGQLRLSDLPGKDQGAHRGGGIYKCQRMHQNSSRPGNPAFFKKPGPGIRPKSVLRIRISFHAYPDP